MMASGKIRLYLGVCLSVWSITTADEIPKAENVRWISLDFTTLLIWTAKPSNHTYTVLYSMDGSDWTESSDCIRLSDSKCDLTNQLVPLDRTYSADIQTDSRETDYTVDVDDLPHTYSSHFNPYRESNISAVKFSVMAVDDNRVGVNITDPVTAFHPGGKQLTIREILKNDLKYKITYYKEGSTGKREVISDSSFAEVPKLDAGENYCFIVAAFIPSRPKATQQGAWSTQQCTRMSGSSQGLSVGALVGVIFILLTILIIIIIVTVLCCRCCRLRNKSLQTSQTSAPV